MPTDSWRKVNELNLKNTDLYFEKMSFLDFRKKDDLTALNF